MANDWQRAQDVFDRVLAAPASDRSVVLAEACGGDDALRAEVESLLEHDARAGDKFMASPAVAFRPADDNSPDWAQALVGRKIGRYTLGRLVASGGMGCVFEAKQERPARAVALKILRPGFSAPSALARFRLEPEVLGRLQHPNIAQVFEAGVHEDEQGMVPYFAMEFITNAQPLIEYADAQELTTRQRLELFAKVCDAVHHGHQKGIIHRDLKPGNILVGADGGPKVIDFGVARASDADIVMTTQYTHVGDLVGTVHYMSPEQCDGNPAAIDTRTDIYSLGVVLYELLTGAAPYDTAGTTVYAAVRVIKDELPRRPSTVIGWDGRPARRLRGDIDAILLKALEKDPARRYVSAADLAKDIRRHLAGEPIEARPPGPWRRVLRWAGRRPRTTALMGTLLMCGLIAGGVAVGVKTYVWRELLEPDAIEHDDKTHAPEAKLLSRNKTVLHTWQAGEHGGIKVARLICPDLDNAVGRCALIGFNSQSLPDRACQLRLYDVSADLDRPVWARQLVADDLPQSVRNKGMTPDQFSPANVWMMDIFPEAQPPRVNEIVCQFAHNKNSLRALCIFAADGELLYRVWHDGGLFDCYWMAGPRLLVVAGENWERYPHERGCPKATPGARMLVVFALRPERGEIGLKLLDTSVAGSGDELVWYKWLSVCPIPNIAWSWDLNSPAEGDTSSTAELGMSINTVPPCAISWYIDADGNHIEGTLVAPSYIMARSLNPDLPPIETFRLEDVPPGQ